MKVKTSITLSEDVLRQIDRLAKRDGSRSEVIDEILRKYLSDLQRERRNARDIEIINKNAKRLNREALDVLEY